MANSIKLDNDQYVDATGVYDSTLGGTQASMNQNFAKAKSASTGGAGTITINMRGMGTTVLVMVGHPYHDWYGLYLVFNGYTQTSYMHTILASSVVSSISKTDNYTLQIVTTDSLFATVIGK